MIAASTWIHPNQSDFYRLPRDATRGEMFLDRHGLVVGIAMTATMLVAVAASVPYWRAVGVLTP